MHETFTKSPISPNSPLIESEKSKRYDRQLRLWGENGQASIENANICLINASALGTEILKSLVLPGIGSFTIIDSAKITDEDFGKNFFLEKDSIGKSRAQITTQLLMEMNCDVRGDYLDESVDELIAQNEQFFTNFSVVIATDLWSERALIKLSQILWNENIPLIVCFSYGFIGYIRLQIAEHTIIESHPDNVHEDLRLDDPFPELKEYLSTQMNFDHHSANHLSHTPYIIIIYKYLKEWQTLNSLDENRLPNNHQEKEQLKTLIRNGMRKHRTMLKIQQQQQQQSDIERLQFEEAEVNLENFEEAIKAVNNVLIRSDFVTSETMSILKDERLKSKSLLTIDEQQQKQSNSAGFSINQSSLLNKPLTRYNDKFWLLAKALEHFMQTKSKDCLPVRGTLPDMNSDTTRYIQLQNIYIKKAREDIESIHSSLQDICSKNGLQPECISDKMMKLFCKNAHCLRLIRTSMIANEFISDSNGCQLNKDKISENSAEVEQTLGNSISNKTLATIRELVNSSDLNGDGNNDLILYLMLRAVIRFFSNYNRFPGYCTDQVESDISELKSCFKEMLNDYGLINLSKDDYIHEMCRIGGSELHSVSSFLGGCIAHEVIKLITNQYIPLNSTLIYNAISSTTATFNW